MVYKIARDGEREIFLTLACCPWHNCDNCSLAPELVKAVEKVLREHPKEWK